MNNPYRARPARARVDHASVPAYGSRNQNTWNTMPPQGQQGTQSSNVYQQPSNPMIQPQQQQQPQDPWEWSTDNGNNGNNDSWNWSVDQKSESQQHLQQHQFPSSHVHSGQTNQNPQPGIHYQNANRNNRPNVLNQYPTFDGTSSRTSLSSGSTANHKEAYNQYTSYDYDQSLQQRQKQPPQQPQQQQYHVPPRPNSKSSPALPDHVQWSANSQQVPNLPPISQNPVARESIDKIQTPPLPPPTNNYNWHSSGQPSSQYLQNHPNATGSGTWQEPLNKQQSMDNQNQWQPSVQASQPFVSPKEYSPPINNENSSNWNNHQQQSNLPNHWPTNHLYGAPNESKLPDYHQNSAFTTTNQWQQSPYQSSNPSEEPVSGHSTAMITNQQNRNIPTNLLQQPLAHHETSSANDWTPSPRPTEFARTEPDTPSMNRHTQDSTETIESHKSLNDWQHNQSPPSQLSSSPGPSVSLSSNSVEQIVSTKKQISERKRSVGMPVSSAMLLSDPSIQTKPNVIERKSLDESHWSEPEINAIPNNPENVAAQNSSDVDWSTTDEWSTVPTGGDLSSGFSQLSLSGKSNKLVENQAPQSDMHSSFNSNDGWNSQPISGSLSENLLAKSSRESIANAQPDHFRDVSEKVQAAETDRQSDNQSIPPPLGSQEHTSPHTYQTDNSRVSEVAPQNAGYDQWYAQRNTAVQSENNWYRQDNQSRPQNWTPEQNIENYENIQQSAEFVNLEVVTPMLQKRNIYGSHDSINRETLDNEPKSGTSQLKDPAVPRDLQEDINNVEVPTLHQPQQSLQVEQGPDNYEFASNDRNTFLETGELTDSHQQHEPSPPSQEDENDEVPNDIPFLREVPGQSSNSDPRRNDPTGQEQNIQVGLRNLDPRRNDPSGQEHNVQPMRNISDRTERRDVPSGQERNIPLQVRADTELLERRNDPSGRERSLPPQQFRNDAPSENRRTLPDTRRNDPSGEECLQPQLVPAPEPTDLREVPGRGNDSEELTQPVDNGVRQIPGGASHSEGVPISNDREDARVVPGSQKGATLTSGNPKHDQSNETRSKREEAVGASLGENQGGNVQLNRRDSYEEGDDEGSGNSREESRERRRERSSERRGYEYDRKSRYYDRDRDYDEDYYYEPRRGVDFERAYNSREDLDRRDTSYRDDERRHTSRDDLDRRGREKEELDRRSRGKDDLDDRRKRDNDRRKVRDGDTRARDPRDYDPRYVRDREYPDRERGRETDRRGRRYEDYDPRDSYRRDYYEDPYTRSSRPSSRSSYNDRDRDYYTRGRDPYYGYNGTKAYGGGYADYTSNYGTNYYAYLENLRRTNPAAYMEWYHKYYASQHQQPQAARGGVNYSEDRASVHSGRSSCDERTTGDKRTLGDISLLEDTAIGSARLTPTKFSTSHVKVSFSTGSLVHMHASYPADGELARVDILRVSSLLAHDPIVRELVAYPGPLIKQVGVTHKKTIIEYCEAKIKKAEYSEDVDDPPSYILLYELMVMLIRQNGNVVGVDIAELLLSNQKSYPYNEKQRPIHARRESVISQKSVVTSGDELNRDTATPLDTDEKRNLNNPLSIDQVTDHFRELLLYGCGQEALEYAMDNGLWGHALFLASKLDKRTHASVMTRFANGLTANDPLQTLYQLQSGRVPASVTCVAEPKWGDWRPHLAMIISNTSPNPDINRKAITTLGDTLMGRGHIHAAHFCYILAQVDFGPYGAPTSKLVLLGSNPNKPYKEFVTNEAIMFTEIYEYARNLSEPGFMLVDLQTFKYGLAVKMVDYGLTEKALLYIEQIAVNIAREPSKYQLSFIEHIHNLGDRIKYNDPVCKDSIDDAANLTWLNNLKEIVDKCKNGEIIQESMYDTHATNDDNNINQPQEQYNGQQPQQHWGACQPEYHDGPTSLMEVPTVDVQREWQPMSLPNTIQDPYTSNNQNPQYIENSPDVTQNQQPQSQLDYWGQQGYSQPGYTAPEYSQTDLQQQPEQSQYRNEQVHTDNVQQEWNYESKKEEKPPTPDPQPTISMGPSKNKQYDPLAELDALDNPTQSSKLAGGSKKPVEKPSEKKNAASGSSWFGGFFSKLAPKPKNQMILPDDSDPTIVWDAVGKKWTNKDADGDESSGAPPPPPKASEMGFRLPQTESLPPVKTMPSSVDHSGRFDEVSNNVVHKPPTGNNMFKMPKGRSLRANYVDVMNPGGSKSGAAAPSVTPPTAAAPMPNTTTSPQFFIPAPVNDPGAPVDFLTSASVANGENLQQGLSRWSSASSLSREVQSYTMRDPRLLQQEKVIFLNSGIIYSNIFDIVSTSISKLVYLDDLKFIFLILSCHL
ncbi:uncharacterized protein LOC105694018 isoform X4 [Athalia rosae]|uniref:uncharacterized protein LOC105694018 isoform X4 n=1 Tax=Athalia rosae TaxID=37344 RepID=UPI00203330CD|nr:uncharacterized protein LOC105694018 isoform X4 [Athalia rosae]